MVGSTFEWNNKKTKDFNLFNPENFMTDDSLLTIEVAKALMNYYPLDYSVKSIETFQNELISNFTTCVKNNKGAGWGGMFYDWAHLPPKAQKPYNSFGNGGPMRISPVGWVAKSLDEVKVLSKIVTEITHNHPEGIKGAEAIAVSIFLAREGKTKEYIKDYITKYYYPRLATLNYKALLANYTFDVTSQGSVPEAIYCFLISTDFEDAIRTAVSIGGDTDTVAAMTGSIAEAFYRKEKPPKLIDEFVYLFINPELEVLINVFYKQFRR